MTNTRTFTTEQLDELDIGPWNCVASIPGDKARWYTWLDLIFEHEGQYWMVAYMEPATEMQDGQEVWYEEPVDGAYGVKATEVHKVPQIVETWKPVGLEPKSDPAAFWIIDHLIDDLHDMNDGEAPFGLYAQTKSRGRQAVEISPDQDAGNWEMVEPEYDRIPEHKDLPAGTAPDTPVVLVVAKRIR